MIVPITPALQAIHYPEHGMSHTLMLHALIVNDETYDVEAGIGIDEHGYPISVDSWHAFGELKALVVDS